MTLSTVHKYDKQFGLDIAEYWRVPEPSDLDSFKTHKQETYLIFQVDSLKLIHQFSGKSWDFNVAGVWCLFIFTMEIDDLS